MAEKHFVQQFAVDFDGINAECSPIEAEGNEVNRAVNYEIGAPNALRGRLGVQMAAHKYGFFGIFPYTYSRTQDQYVIKYQTPTAQPSIASVKTLADGATISKLLGVGAFPWLYETFDVSVTNVSASNPITWYSTVWNGGIHFIIKGNGVTLLDFDCGDGFTTSKSIYELLLAINGTAQFSINPFSRDAAPPIAIVNGAQSPVLVGARNSYTHGSVFSLQVDAGHTFYPGDVICFPRTYPYNDIWAGIVVAVTATQINFVGNPRADITIPDDQVLGYQMFPAGAFEIAKSATSSASPFTIAMPYWRAILPGTQYDQTATQNHGPFYMAFQAKELLVDTYRPPTATNAAGNIYLGLRAYPQQAIKRPFDDLLAKIDGQILTSTGLPPVTLQVALGGGALNGIYRYKIYAKRVDAQGNIIEGKPSAVRKVTHLAGSTTLTCRGPRFTDATGACTVRGGFKYTLESPAAGVSFMVDDNSAAPGNNCIFQVGDPICFNELLNNTGTFHRTVVTAIDGTTTPASIQVADSSGYSIENDVRMSTGLSIVVLRTVAGGNQFYKLVELASTGYGDVTYTDNIADAVLSANEQYIETPTGKEHDQPPYCSLVCQHQGGLVVAGDPTKPNTVSFSSDEGIEYFPLASTNFDIPATVSGPISAIASDTTDRLAIFKQSGYYEAVGDLPAGVFTVNVNHEGDYGITSQASIARINGQLVGLSKLGVISISQGTIDAISFSKINARLVNQKFRFDLACGANDYVNRQYVISIPPETANDGASTTLIIDYSRKKVLTFERAYNGYLSPGAGFALVDGKMFHLSFELGGGVFRRLYRFNNDSPTGNNGDSFIDHIYPITYILESQPMNFGEPALTKSPKRVRIWSIPNDYVVNGWVPFNVQVDGGPTPISSYIGSGFPQGFTSVLSFANEQTDWFKDTAIPTCKAQFYILRFTTSSLRTSPFISGYEVMFLLDYEKEDFIR